MKLSEVFSQAADLIEQAGWTRGRYYDGQNYCVAGALRKVTGYLSAHPNSGDIIVHNEQHAEFYREAFYQLRAVLGADPIDWNDSRGQCKENIISNLRMAAELQRKVENSVVTTEPELEPA